MKMSENQKRKMRMGMTSQAYIKGRSSVGLHGHKNNLTVYFAPLGFGFPLDDEGVKVQTVLEVVTSALINIHSCTDRIFLDQHMKKFAKMLTPNCILETNEEDINLEISRNGMGPELARWFIELYHAQHVGYDPQAPKLNYYQNAFKLAGIDLFALAQQ